MKSNIFKTAYIIFLISLITSCDKKVKNELWLASGAGYKKPVNELINNFSTKTGIEVVPIFGNMQTVSEQIKQSGNVQILIGDKKFLENKKLGVKYENYTSIGKGILVLAYSKNSPLRSVESITDSQISRISLPDRNKAIYGLAAYEYLTSRFFLAEIEDKIIPAATVPQVSSYLISGEIDAGFINLTDAIAIESKIGGYYKLKDGYSEIQIVAGLVEEYKNDSAAAEFLKFLKSSESIKILKRYGLYE